MITVVWISGILIFFFLLESLYFLLADKYNIIDKPNNRSSHTAVTIRGGGIIFLFAALTFFACRDFQFPYFIVGLFLISLISFLDDILTLNNKVRILIHLVSVSLLLFELGLFGVPIYIPIISAIFIIGAINAYNFMDGINGITGLYSLVAIGTLSFINQKILSFVDADLFIYLGLSLVVFLFFNFRKKAKCFAGDVGSISIAFTILFLIGKLIIQTGDFAYILLLLIYGLDAVITITFRLIRKENIFEAHRSHFYQYLANEKKIPHLYVSAGYGILQMLVNVLILEISPISAFELLLIVFGTTCLVIWMRLGIEGKERLLKKTVN